MILFDFWKFFCKSLSCFFSSSNKTFRVCCWKAIATAEIDQRDAHRVILRQNEVFFAYGPLFGLKTMCIFCEWDEISIFLPRYSRPTLLSASIHNLVISTISSLILRKKSPAYRTATDFQVFFSKTYSRMRFEGSSIWVLWYILCYNWICSWNKEMFSENRNWLESRRRWFRRIPRRDYWGQVVPSDTLDEA